MPGSEGEAVDDTHRVPGHITVRRVFNAILGDRAEAVSEAGRSEARLNRAAVLIAGLVEPPGRKGALSADELDRILSEAAG